MCIHHNFSVDELSPPGNNLPLNKCCIDYFMDKFLRYVTIKSIFGKENLFQFNSNHRFNTKIIILFYFFENINT